MAIPKMDFKSCATNSICYVTAQGIGVNLMRTDTTAVRFSEIAVIDQDLKSIFGIAIQLQPMIELIAPKSCFHAMFSTVIIDMVNAQKVPIINAATGTL